MMSSIFDSITKKHLKEFIHEYGKVVDIDEESIYNTTLSHIKNHSNSVVDDKDLGRIKEIEDHWYESQSSGNPDYSVYADPYYICDVWFCWKDCSRRHLLNIQRDNSLFEKSIVSDLDSIDTVLDIGCGFGYTTAALKEIFPDASVIGTNLKETAQYDIATKIGAERGFSITDEYSDEVDLIFASEYFEHFKEPINHLFEVVKKYNPKYMIIANAFSNTAIGHFDEYVHDDQIYVGGQMTRFFNNTMRSLGFEKQKTKCWNDKPSYWKKID